ncbi:MAG: P-II family nitrogen regulator [Christensenellales bacterium]
MKKIEIIIRPEKLDEVRALLDDLGVTGLMITSITGYGNQKGLAEHHLKNTPKKAGLVSQYKLETVVGDEKVDGIINSIINTVATGEPGDGKIFVYNVEDAIRIRTGEKGESAM